MGVVENGRVTRGKTHKKEGQEHERSGQSSFQAPSFHGQLRFFSGQIEIPARLLGPAHTTRPSEASRIPKDSMI